MRIFVPNESKQTVGGGWSFLRNFEKYASRKGIEIVSSSYKYQDGDVLFVSGATMVPKEIVYAARDAGMKIVLRVDNAPRNSRNRNTGTSRLKAFAELADVVVYQSSWARVYLEPFLGKSGPVIINGADPDIFNTYGSRRPKEGSPQFLYARSSRDETKRWEEAWYEFSMAHRQWPDSHLWIIGEFSGELRAGNFDFFMGEKYDYAGQVEDPRDMAEYLRSTDWLLLPFYNDACSNTLIEARMCGVEKIHYSSTGGTPEIMEMPLPELSADVMVDKYLQVFRSLS